MGKLYESSAAQEVADAAAAGVTLTTTCPNSRVGTEIAPLYLSNASVCAGNSLDPTASNSLLRLRAILHTLS